MCYKQNEIIFTLVLNDSFKMNSKNPLQFSIFHIFSLEITYCETCPWRKSHDNTMFNFNTSCICKIKKHRKKSIIVTGNSYTYLCRWCIRFHTNLIQNNEPLNFCCTHDIYDIGQRHYWNRLTTHFCDRCINYRISHYLGHCWYCNNYNMYLINYVDGRN